MTRDCIHGQLARSCDRCADAAEIAELRDQLAAMTAERDLLIQTLKMARGAVLAERQRCAAIADTMRIDGAIPDTAEAAQDWCAYYIADEIRGPNVGIEPPRSGRLE